ncbi:MAG TPA: FGGY-family carbohydrate kinase, partial [Candidatus Sulfotelmatobacter sp.]|nr:FGGY-family carbohydrate kinase [Candidatus Sulfotelmatobacter sp.]
PERLPAGAYAHRLRLQTWLPGAASNAGGGTLVALERGADLAALDRECTFPAVSVAYPLARPGERFPVADSRFGGFGVPDEDGATRHAVILEGLAMITRLGVEKLMAGGVPDPELIRVTGGGSSSEPWMQVTANVLDRRLVSVPELDPAVGAALLAAASVSERRLEDLTPAPGATGEAREYEPDPELARVYRERYGEFLDKLA